MKLSGAIEQGYTMLHGKSQFEEIQMNGPKWLSEAVFYEVYPQSFLDTNGDGIGDIKGIIAKLDYIKSLGCNAIWMNPCFESPFADAGYDVSDFYKVAPRYGTNKDLARLFAQAKKRGMHVVLDLVAGHTSLEHPWFKESCKATKNKYTNRYIWTDSVWRPDSDSRMILGYAQRDGNYLCNFFWFQPALNYGFAKPDPKKSWQLPMDHPDCVAMCEELKNIMRFWLDMGASGFRVDMAPSLVKGDTGGKHIAVLWREMREMFDRDYPEAALISEWFNPPAAVKAGFHVDFMSQGAGSGERRFTRCCGMTPSGARGASTGSTAIAFLTAMARET
jgi:glycosidase